MADIKGVERSEGFDLVFYEAVCVKCGAVTYWDGDLGPDPLCQVCFDKAVARDNALVNDWPRLVGETFGRVYCNRYYAEHLEKMRDWHMNYYWEHHWSKLLYQAVYYVLNREEILAKARARLVANRASINARRRLRYRERGEVAKAQNRVRQRRYLARRRNAKSNQI
jgi:hypothetical protein